MPASPEKEQLNAALRHLAAGDRRAARTVFEILWPRVLVFCTKALGDSALAEDVAQKTLMQLFGKVTAFDPSREGLAWALEMAVWECRSEIRRRVRSKEVAWEKGPAESVEAVAESPEQAFERHELQRALESAAEGLSAADRETILAIILEQRTPVAAATWRKRKERAVMRLKVLWRVLHGND